MCPNVGAVFCRFANVIQAFAGPRSAQSCRARFCEGLVGETIFGDALADDVAPEHTAAGEASRGATRRRLLYLSRSGCSGKTSGSTDTSDALIDGPHSCARPRRSASRL